MNGGEGTRSRRRAEGKENESARRLRAREPLFLDLAHFSMPVDSYPNLPSLSFSRASSSLLSSTYSAPLRSFGSLARLLHLPTRSPPSAAVSTTDGFFHYVYTIAKDDDINAFSRSSARFRKP